MNILECSSRGDKRFSAFYAVVDVNGKKDTIENHYQLSKRFGEEPAPTHWKQCKGRKPTHFVVNDVRFELDALSTWYDILWEKYLDQHPELVEFLENFDGYNDMFAKPGCNNQANSIARYMKYKKYMKEKEND